MNPWDLSSSDLLVWGILLHFIADWPLQNDWMAANKADRRTHYNPGPMVGERGTPYTRWWDRHPAAFVHAGIHTALLALIFGWLAIPLGITHLIIDTRVPVVWWSKLVRQSQPVGRMIPVGRNDEGGLVMTILYDIGMEVRFWTDQVFHLACLGLFALLTTI